MSFPIPQNAVIYRSHADDPRAPTLLAITSGGRCLLQVGSSRAQRQLPVGWFKGSVPPNLMTSLRHGLFTEAFRNSASLGPTSPDAAVRAITLPSDGGGTSRITKLASSRSAAPEFATMESIFISIISHIRQFPATALVIEAARHPPRSRPGETIEMLIRLRNPGPDPVLVPVPENWMARDGHVELSALSASGGALPRSGGEQQCFASCAARPSGNTRARGVRGLVPIPAGDCLEVELSAALDWPQGQYVADLTAALKLHDGERVHRASVVLSATPFRHDVMNDQNGKASLR